MSKLVAVVLLAGGLFYLGWAVMGIIGSFGGVLQAKREGDRAGAIGSLLAAALWVVFAVVVVQSMFLR